MRNTTMDRTVLIAMDLFVKHGFHKTTVSEVLSAANVSESTFRRHFRHGLIAVYKAALTRTAAAMAQAYRTGQEGVASTSQEVATRYLEAVLGFYFSEDSFCRGLAILLFGAQGRPASRHSLSQEYEDDAIWADASALSSDLAATGADERQVRCITHLVLGSLTSFISSEHSDRDEGQKLVELVQSALAPLSKSGLISSDELERDGVSKAKLRQMAQDAECLALSIKKALT